MDIKYFDAHTHVQFAAYDEDREEVIARAEDLGVGMVNVGTTLETSKIAVELTHKNSSHIYAAVGIHPIHAAKYVRGHEYHDALRFCVVMI